jgi:hypothetical protein
VRVCVRACVCVCVLCVCVCVCVADLLCERVQLSESLCLALAIPWQPRELNRLAIAYGARYHRR